ncbi:nuclease [Oleiphilus messinensis]|uniref:phosphodiesterase I n=1 Tax=Oleiphilus messinensis TaxID=141451 RepID=A0A1Y0IEJ5_9GAMM|nr:VRR-NUC domain-containing protein [Oleiphilus messinensis]ARU58958.1 nuclease [Oleiphilus messinensis]
MAIELEPEYYLDNFRQLTDFVTVRYSDLLDLDEARFLSDFAVLSRDAQKLYVRMLTRKGDVFRRSKLQYAEITDIDEAARELARMDFIDTNPSLSLDTILKLFSKPEITAAVGDESLNRLRRDELEQSLLADATRIPELIACVASLDELFLLCRAQVFDTLKLLFFGNLRQDMTEFVLKDLGLYTFAEYSLDDESRFFHHRDQVNAHLHYYGVLDQFTDDDLQDASRLTELIAQLPVAPQEDRVLRRRVERVKLKFARQLERLGDLDLALAWYRECQTPPSRERQSRILIQQSEIEAGLALCETILETPRNEEELVFAQSFGARTARKHKHPWRKIKAYKPPEYSLVLPNQGQRVEMAVQNYFNESVATDSAGDNTCYYVENTLINSVFGLSIWEMMFASVPGAFFNPFQIMPSDFYERDFVECRKPLYEQWQTRVSSSDELSRCVLQNYERYYGQLNPLVFWGNIEPELLKTACHLIPITDWQHLFQRIFTDIKHNRSGLPDLILFHPDGLNPEFDSPLVTDRSYQLVEVKGPGDKLQKNQLRWMTYFAEHDIPHSVLNVTWDESP